MVQGIDKNLVKLWCRLFNCTQYSLHSVNVGCPVQLIALVYLEPRAAYPTTTCTFDEMPIDLLNPYCYK